MPLACLLAAAAGCTQLVGVQSPAAINNPIDLNFAQPNWFE